MSSFFDLNIAVSALRAQQYALSVTGQNIANANTSGYRRQDIQFEATTPSSEVAARTPSGAVYLGTGVTVSAVRRLQDQYMDTQYRLESQNQGMWESRSNSLNQIETLFPEPGGSGLNNMMDQFWNSWQDLASSPESVPDRTAVIEKATALADRLREVYNGMRTMQMEMNNSVEDKVTNINRIASQIATLNVQITQSSIGDSKPNDLMDMRDNLLEQLSKAVKVDAQGTTGNDTIVSIDGKTLVQGGHVNELSLSKDSTGLSSIKWSDDNSAVSIRGGELKGLMDVRDGDIPQFIASLNQIASGIVNAVNAAHAAGADTSGNPAGTFFVAGSDASNIAVNPAVVADPTKVAASGNGSLGDNSTAVAISKLSSSIVIGGQTISAAYAALVGSVGAKTQEATVQLTAHNSTLTQLQNQRDSISGVSLDEEMTNMIKYQKSYDAAARVVTMINDMLDTVINRMAA